MIAISALLLGVLYLADGARVTRMIGGHDAPLNSHPYLVSFRQSEDPRNHQEYFHFCSGSIVNQEWILTAASCFDKRDPTSTWAVVGTNNFFDGGYKYKIQKVVFHDNYDLRYRNNIALVRLIRPMKFNDAVQPIKLPKNDFNDYNTTGLFAGWAVSNNNLLSDKLQQVQLPIISNEECKKDRRGYITGKHLCTYAGEDAGLCYEDIGGPLLVDDIQVGLASYAIPCNFGWPDVYTKVFSYVKWIQDTIHRYESN